MTKLDFEKAEAELRMLEEEYNISSAQKQLHIACGFACKEIEGENMDINQLIRLADQRMYNNKRVMKDDSQ